MGIISSRFSVLGSQFWFRFGSCLRMQVGWAACRSYWAGGPNHLVSAGVSPEWV